MEVESFESEEIAKLQNDWFINIKVSSSISHRVLSLVTAIMTCDYLGELGLQRMG